MAGMEIILAILVILVLLGAQENFRHKRNLAKIPIRIHVNGTRGKSSVVRLIAGGFREAGIVTCAKTTGTMARFIMPDAGEYEVFRPAGPNVIEQVRIVAVAAANNAQALVLECMALQPELQWLTESKFIRATHGVITNAREDHLEIMGPRERDVALALAATTPVRALLFTGEKKHLNIFEKAARDRLSQLIQVSREDEAAITDEEMAGFSYEEHRENVALALKVCEVQRIERETALQGMWKALPDPGVFTISHVRFFGRHIFFANAFAANDPESTRRLWEFTLQRHPDVNSRIIIFNCRADRPVRSQQIGEACAAWPPADHYLLMGTGTYFFAKSAISSGIKTSRIIFAENLGDNELFEIIIDLSGSSTLVVGMGNIKGQGLSLTRFFHNRSILKEKEK
jgi:poly-gamma-glutamate synthase PgsB/CapB